MISESPARIVNSISNRLSLRRPQRESLEILSRLAETVPLSKDRDLDLALDIVKSEFPSVESFERDFPSLCFALATGVGKTRLMGAFIAYLYLAEGKRNFFVLAPNLTIYEKLIEDFTPNTPKYVFQGIAEFSANPPFIVTGDNYDQRPSAGSRFFDDVQINIFNVSKINSETRGGKSPRIKRLSEYIGESYFDYLAGLDDLVMLMDESHHYRATSGMRAINELNPVLGLELTATPYTASGKKNTAFQNVVYSYPLPAALADGFVKEPAVATRENFDASAYDEEGLDLLKLRDGVRIHESVKVELETYARRRDERLVKPFMLVVARDIAHADWIVSEIKSEDFFGGRYRDRVIRVDSKQMGTEKEENVQRLLAVESAYEPTEIVVHVNKLKEGWDVTNLYTIVPLRAAKAEILVEQTIGRGLRLPYGKQTGVAEVDRLTIVAHDKFQEIIEEANAPDSLIKSGVFIGRDIAAEETESITVEPKLHRTITGTDESETSMFENPEDRKVAGITLEAIKRHESEPTSEKLREPEVMAEIVRDVTATYEAGTGPGGEASGTANIQAIVGETIDRFRRETIDIPRITVAPKGETTFRYGGFALDLDGVNFQPIEQTILIQHLSTSDRHTLFAEYDNHKESRPEDYIVRQLMDFDDVSYDEHADLLYDLAGQTIEHLRSYLNTEDDVENVAAYYEKKLAEVVHGQMRHHQYVEGAGVEYEVNVSKGFTVLEPNNYTVKSNEASRNFRSVVEGGQIRNLVFDGFERCMYPLQKFDSRPEKTFATILEDDRDSTLKWFKPALGQFRIYYDAGTGGERIYNPDFVVESSSGKLICEVKRTGDIDDVEVQAKARAAATWCENATAHELANGGKKWKYLLIPDAEISAASTLGYLADNFTFRL